MGSLDPKEMSVKQTLRIYYNAAKKHRTNLLLSLLHPIGGLLMGVAVPFLASRVLASLTQPTPRQTTYLVLLGITTVLTILANRFGFRNIMKLQAKTMADLNGMLFERLLSRSVGFHVNRISGKLISDTLDFIQSFGMLMSAGVMNGLIFILVIFVGLVVVFINTWQLGIYLLAVVIGMLSWTWIETKRRAELRHKRLIATKNLTAHLSDTLVNAQTVKTFAREETETAKNRHLNNLLLNLRLRDWQRAGRSGNNRMGTLLVVQFCMIIFIVYLVRKDPAILGTAIFALTYTMTFSNRLLDLNTISMQIDEAFLNAGPMTRMLLQNVEIKDHPGAKGLKVPKGRIHVDNASFAYKESRQDTTVFEKLTLDIAPGEKVGLIGPSGGGKSTLTRLLLRFDDLDSGAIEIDDQNIAGVTQTSLRHNIAYVPQEPLLFHRSIRENIAYGKPDATGKQLYAAARQAQAHDFILQLPDGYDTIVGERGVKLSGGQRQRIAIARAILKDAPILVLDEATSALDSESEVAIQKALWQLMEGRTAIVVAHRLSTIQRMDRIIVLNDGKIIEIGTHKQLLQKKGLYAQLWGHQSGGFLED